MLPNGSLQEKTWYKGRIQSGICDVAVVMTIIRVIQTNIVYIYMQSANHALTTGRKGKRCFSHRRFNGDRRTRRWDPCCPSKEYDRYLRLKDPSHIGNPYTRAYMAQNLDKS